MTTKEHLFLINLKTYFELEQIEEVTVTKDKLQIVFKLKNKEEKEVKQ